MTIHPEDLLAEHRFVESLVRRLLGRGADADDALQSAWLRAFQSRRSVRADARRAWLARVVRSVVADARRTERRRRSREADAPAAATPPTPEEVLEREQRRRDVVEAVLGLPADDRDIVLMRHWQHLEPREIAARLGVPAATVRSRLLRARELLRQRLDARYGDRGSWIAAMAPLLGRPSIGPGVALGMLVMSTKNIAVAIGAVLLAWFAVAWAEGRADAPLARVAAAADPDPEAAVRAVAATGVAAAGPSGRRVVQDPGLGEIVVLGSVRDAVGPVAGLAVDLTFRSGADRELRWTRGLRSDADGGVAWRGAAPLEDGVLELRPAAGVAAIGSAWVVWVAGVAPAPLLLRVTHLGCEVRGVVRTARGESIVDAVIRCARGVETRSDTQGRYTLRCASGTQVLEVHADRHAYLRRAIEVPPGAATFAADFTLDEAERVVGRVLDPDGRPVAGARVVASRCGDAAAVSDTSGEFRITWIPAAPGTLELTAEHPRFAPSKVQVDPGAGPVEIVLGGVGSLRGVVVDESGRGVPAAVFVRHALVDGVAPDAVSDAHGRFLIAHLPAGRALVTALARGRSLARHEVAIARGALADVTMIVGAARAIEGIVVDDRGVPVADAGVLISEARESGRGRSVRSARTGSDGRFRVDELLPGSHDVAVIAGGHRRVFRRGVAGGGPPIEFVLPRHASLAGRVVDGDSGLPVDAFTLRFVPAVMHPGDAELGGYAASWEEGHQVAAAHGVWRVDEDFEPGEVTGIEVIAPGYAIGRLDRVVAAPDPDPDVHVLRLARGVAVAGTVRSESTGAPVVGAEVHLMLRPERFWQVDHGSLPNLRTDAEGRFAFDARVDDGAAFHLLVRSADGTARLVGPLTADGAPLAVAMGSAARVAGRVQGDPVGETIVLVPIDALGIDAPRRGATDRYGRFRFEAVPPGQYELIVGEPDIMTAPAARLLVHGAGTDTLTVDPHR